MAKDTKEKILAAALDMFTPIFAAMMDRGLLRREDEKMLVFAYTAPISALIHLCDREPEKTGEAMTQIEAFSRHFVQTYGEKTENGHNDYLTELWRREL